MGKLAPELIWALRQQALWGREQEADKTTPGQKENTSWPLLLGVMVLLMIVMMMMRRRRKKEHYGHFLKGSWCCCWWFWWRGVPWLMGMESHSRSNGNRQAVTKRIKQAEPWQRENRDSQVFSFFLFFIIIFDDAHDGLLRWGWLSWQHLTRPTYQTIGNCATRSNCWLSPNRFQTLVITVGVHRGQRWGVISEAAVKRPHWHRPSAFLRLTKDLLGPLPTIGLPLFVVKVVE